MTLQPQATFTLAAPQGHTAIAYVFEGAGCFGADDQSVEAVRMVIFNDGDQIEVSTDTGVRFMLFAGAPFREPIAPYGPFVMNTPAEIQQAIAELRAGTFIRA